MLTITEQIASLEAERVALAQKAGGVGYLSPAEQDRLKELPGLIAGLFAAKRAEMAGGRSERTDYRRAMR